MDNSKNKEGASTDSGGTASPIDHNQNLLNKELRDPVALEEYIRPFELAGSLSLPIRMLTVIAVFFM